jgi:hypothetical protein
MSPPDTFCTPSQEQAMASPATPKATKAAPAANVKQPTLAQKQTGKALWAKARAKTKVIRVMAIRHELEHRAKEKVAFGVIERVLARCQQALATYVLGNLGAASAHEKARGGVAKVVAKTKDWVARHVLRKKPAKMPTPLPPPSSAIAVKAILDSMHVAIPLAGTYLLAHMAHHDWHRARSEWKERRAIVPTSLFFIGAACDALDALAHGALVLYLLLGWATAAMGGQSHGHGGHGGHGEHGGHGGHDVDGHGDGHGHDHTEHMLHEASMFVAMIACGSMMLGEALSTAEDGHGHDHGHGHGHGHDSHHAKDGKGHAAAEPTLQEKLKALAKKEAGKTE